MALILRSGRGTDYAQAGVYGTPGGIVPVIAPGQITANRLYALRFVPLVDKLIVSGSYGLSTVATSDDAVDIGIFDAQVGGALLMHSGSTTGKLNGSAGRRVINMITPTWIRAGVPYYSCMVGAAAGTAAFVGMMSLGNAKCEDLFGVGDGNTVASPHQECGFFANGSATLPNTLPALGTITTVPVLAWRET